MPKKIKVLDSKSGYNLTADYYSSREKYWDSFEKGRVLPLLGEVKNKKILDVGAGTGRLALKLVKSGAAVTALDVSEEMLKRIRDTGYGIRVIVGDAENLPFENETFDIVIATFLVVHLKDLKIFFDEAYRVLKPGGLFLLTNINQREAPVVETKKGPIEIESYYHRPERIIEDLEVLAFSIEKNNFVYENDIWVNQIIAGRK